MSKGRKEILHLGGQHYPIKDMFLSKSFLQSFGLDSIKMTSSGRDNAKVKSADDVAHVIGDEGESHIS